MAENSVDSLDEEQDILATTLEAVLQLQRAADGKLEELKAAIEVLKKEVRGVKELLSERRGAGPTVVAASTSPASNRYAYSAAL